MSLRIRGLIDHLYFFGILAVGFFDGASQERGETCGAGAVLKCPVLGTFRIKMNCGSGTNTKAELLALWCILFFAHYKKVTRLQLVGDSKVIIDWFTNANNLQVVYLQPWMKKIRDLNRKFTQLKIQHIYRGFNMEADQLSKATLSLEEDGLYYAAVNEGHADLFDRIDIV
jgi:ribonuclease HI